MAGHHDQHRDPQSYGDQRAPRVTRRALIAGSLAGGIAGLALSSPAAARLLSRGAADGWEQRLDSVGGDVIGVARQDGGLALTAPLGVASAGSLPVRQGSFTFDVRRLAEPVDRVWAEVAADAPAGSRVEIDVRVREIGGGWSQWEPATADRPAALPFAGREVQTRVYFTATNGATPALHRLRLRAARTPDAISGAQATLLAPLTYRIFATREGLVGGTTANGHVIRSRDHFVALPSRKALCSRGGREYTVTVAANGRSATEPQWDVGPWNITDDYWNPAAERASWKDLPQGKPEAQAAYQDGYNGGRDGYGRRVANPAGIDLADGTFWDSLDLSDNSWIDVTYNWTNGGGDTWSTIVDDATAGAFTASANWGTSSYSSQRYGTGYRFANPEAVSDPAWWTVNLPEAGNYDVSVWYAANAGYNSSTPYLVQASDGQRTVRVDQRSGGGTWRSIGVYPFAAGTSNAVGVSRWTSTTGYVIADAVRLTRR